MKTLLTSILFICAFSLTSFAQEKPEPIEKEPKFRSSEKASEKVFPSAIKREAPEETKTRSEESRSESADLPYKSRKINDPELIEKRKKAKARKYKAKNQKNIEETPEKQKADNSK